jgi:HEAT repeat protein
MKAAGLPIAIVLESIVLFCRKRRSPKLSLGLGMILAFSSPQLPGRPESEPIYNGRTLSSWLKDLGNTPVGPEYEPAAAAIRHLGTNALPGLLQRIEAGTGQTNFMQANLAVNAIRELGPVAKPAIPELSQLVRKEPSSPFAARALVILRAEAPVVAALTNDNRVIRRHAIIALAEDTVGPAAVPPLVLLLKDKDSETRSLTAWALGRIHKEDAIAVPALMTALGDNVAAVRGSAVEALCGFKPPPKLLIPTLIKALTDKDASVRAPAIRNLAASCRFNDEADAQLIPALLQRLGDENEYARSLAVWALGQIMNGRLGGEHPRDRISHKSLGRFAPQAEIVVPAIVRMLSDSSPNVRANAAYALGDIGMCNPTLDAKMAAALAQALQDSNQRVHDVAAAALKSFAHQNPNGSAEGKEKARQ